jgi:WhiB family redox-sensing transcriptional regulator
VPMTSLAARPPRSVSASTEPTSVLAKRVHIRGLCIAAKVDSATDPWFPVTEVEDELVRRARWACAGCPVIAECRELTLRIESRLPDSAIHGIFGALAPHERRTLIRARRRAGGDAR